MSLVQITVISFWPSDVGCCDHVEGATSHRPRRAIRGRTPSKQLPPLLGQLSRIPMLPVA